MGKVPDVPCRVEAERSGNDLSKDTYTKNTPHTPLEALRAYEEPMPADYPAYPADTESAKTPMDALRGYETDPAPVERAPMAWQIICWGSADPNVPPIGRDALLELVEQGRRVHLVGRFSGWVAATPRRVPLWVVHTPDGPQTLLTPEVHAWYPFPHPTY